MVIKITLDLNQSIKASALSFPFILLNTPKVINLLIGYFISCQIWRNIQNNEPPILPPIIDDDNEILSPGVLMLLCTITDSKLYV